MKIVLTILLTITSIAYGQGVSKLKPDFLAGYKGNTLYKFAFDDLLKGKPDSVRIIGQVLVEFRNSARAVVGVLPSPSTVYIMLPAGVSASGSGKSGDPVIIKALAGTIPTIPTTNTNGTATNDGGAIDIIGVTNQINAQASQLASLSALVQAQQAEIARLKADTTPVHFNPYQFKTENGVISLIK